MTGEETSSGWVYPNPNGTHMLVPVEEWKAAIGSKPLSYKYFEEVHRQDDEIELLRSRLSDEQRESARLREAFGLLTTLYPLMEIDVNDPVGMAKEIEQYISKKYQRTDEQIDAAWRKANRLVNSDNTAEHFMGKGMLVALKELGIVRCADVPNGCGGTGLSLGDTCPDCDGHGWVKEPDDE